MYSARLLSNTIFKVQSISLRIHYGGWRTVQEGCRDGGGDWHKLKSWYDGKYSTRKESDYICFISYMCNGALEAGEGRTAHNNVWNGANEMASKTLNL